MNIEFFIAKRLFKEKSPGKDVSRPIVRISVAGIAIGLAVMIITVAIVTAFQSEIRNKIIGFGSHIQITNYTLNNSIEPDPISTLDSVPELLADVPGIKHIQSFAFKNGILKTKNNNEGILLKGVDKNYDWTFIKQNLKEGNVLSLNDSSTSKEIVISRQLAKKLDLKINNKLIVYFVTKKKTNAENASYPEYEQRAKDFYITGIYQTDFEDFDKKFVFVDLKHIQKLNYWDKNEVGGYEILIDDYEKIDRAGDEVFERVGVVWNVQTIKQIHQTIFSWLELQDINAIIVIALMILVASINMISALLILILEKTNMIGTLKALGANNKSIQKVFLYNAFYLIGKGLLWGNIIGISLCFIQKQFGIITLPEETYYVSVIPININLAYILLLNIGTMLICMLMLILPSFIISKITPVKAIRFK